MPDRACSFANCNTKHFGLGFCRPHYNKHKAEQHRLNNPPQIIVDLPGEEWRPVMGYETFYMVSDHGRIQSLSRKRHPGRLLKQTPDRQGRLTVHLSAYGITAPPKQVHLLVLSAFRGQRPAPEMQGCHNDGVCTNNILGNLRWDTASANMQDKKLHGTDHFLNKKVCPRGHELVEPNLKAGHLRKGVRACLACARALSFASGRKRRGHPPIDVQVESDRRYEWIMGYAPASKYARAWHPTPRPSAEE